MTGNYTVNQILDKIRKFKKNISINCVNAPIMNQLYYNVHDRKIKHHGLKLKGSIEKDIKDTLKLLQNLKRWTAKSQIKKWHLLCHLEKCQ